MGDSILKSKLEVIVTITRPGAVEPDVISVAKIAPSYGVEGAFEAFIELVRSMPTTGDESLAGLFALAGKEKILNERKH